MRVEWGDFEPVRALFMTVLVAQLAGAAGAAWFAMYPSWFDNLWAGGALATFPGFLLGLPVQHWWRPGSLSRYRLLVHRFGWLALALSLAAFFMPLG
jgi:hypothetical protein